MLVLAQGSVRLLEVVADLPPSPVEVSDLPADAASAVGKSSIKDRSPVGRIQGSEGQKVRLRQYARRIDEALRPLLNGLTFRSSLPLPSLSRASSGRSTAIRISRGRASRAIPTTPRTPTSAGAPIPCLTDLRRGTGGDPAALRSPLGRGTGGRHRGRGPRRHLRRRRHGLVDIDEVVPGSIGELSGAVTFDGTDDAVNYGVVDEIARRVWLNGGRVLAVRREDIPGRGSVAAILRYSL